MNNLKKRNNKRSEAVSEQPKEDKKEETLWRSTL